MGTEERSTAVVTAKETKPQLRFGPDGLLLDDIEQAFRFAEMAIVAGIAPPAKNKTSKEVATELVIAIVLGKELGVSAMQAIQNIAVINGRPSVWGDLFLGICQRHPKFISCDEWFEGEYDKDDFTAVCEFRREGYQKPVRWEFSVKDAKRANLWGKGTYNLYGKRMLQMRARGFAGRNAFADALKGVYIREEALDMEQVEGTDNEYVFAKPPSDIDELTERLESRNDAKQNEGEGEQTSGQDEGPVGEQPGDKKKTRKANPTTEPDNQGSGDQEQSAPAEDGLLV